jgi:dephospho-CoA kinase
MPGAGKSLASSVAAKRGIPVFVSGDIIRAEAKRRNLSPNRKNLGKLMLKIREEEGMGAVAKRLGPLIDKIDNDLFVYEGARNIEEVEELGKKFCVLTIAIHASPESRFRRLLKRRRSDQPRNWTDFVERDERELKVGVGKLIAIADRVVENEDTKNDLKRRTERLLQTLPN